MRAIILGLLIVALPASPCAASNLERVSRTTVYLRISGNIAPSAQANDAGLVGAECVNIGTGFLVSGEGQVVTARHLITDKLCQVQDSEAAATFNGPGNLLRNVRIEAYLGVYSVQSRAPIGGVVVAENDRLDSALLDLDEINARGYRLLRPCVAEFQANDDYLVYGYRSGNVLDELPGRYDVNLPDLARLRIRGEMGGGMSGGPLVGLHERPIAMLVSGEATDRAYSYAVPGGYLSEFVGQAVGRRFEPCSRNPTELERVGLRLDSEIFLTIDQAASLPEEEAGAAGDAVAQYESNRRYFQERFHANEDVLNEILTRAHMPRDNAFYDRQSNLFEALDQAPARSAARRAEAIIAYADNAFIIAKMNVGLGALQEGLAIEPESLALRLEYASRLIGYERFDEVVRLAERRRDLLVLPDGTPPADQMQYLRLYARALWEVQRNDDSWALFEQLLARTNADPAAPAGERVQRLQLLNDRIPLLTRLHRRDEALRDMQEVLRGYRDLLQTATDERLRQGYENAVGTSENNLAFVFAERGNVQQARWLAASALERKQRARVRQPLAIATSMSNVGSFDVRLGEARTGLEMLLLVEDFYDSYRQYGQDYVLRAARLQREIGFAYLRLGNLDEARARLERSRRELAGLVNPDDEHYLRTLVLLGYCGLLEDRNQQALVELRQADQAARAAPTLDSSVKVLIDLFYGEALVRAGSVAEGRESVRRALAAVEAAPADAEYVMYLARSEVVARAQAALAL